MRFYVKVMATFCVLCTCSLIFSRIEWTWISNQKNKIGRQTNIRTAVHTKQILESPMHKNQSIVLMWRHPWGIESEGIREGSIRGKCFFTYDKKYLHKALAVVFHYTAFDNDDQLTWQHPRHPDQIYVWYNLESPWYLKHVEHRSLHEFYGGFINWTMTYRLDSDVFYPYMQPSLLKGALKEGKSAVDFIISKKKKTALWVVSNCNQTKAALDRFKLVDELMAAGLPVERFGACFNNSREYHKVLKDPEKIYAYKFYLSFENARNCQSYVTEKFWDNGLMSGRVPVVWGPNRKDIEALAPPGSYIHADDYATAENLVAYLMYLNKNEEAYRSYFKWREDPNNPTMKSLIRFYEVTKEEQLCEKARNNQIHKSIPNVAHHFFKKDRKECLQK